MNNTKTAAAKYLALAFMALSLAGCGAAPATIKVSIESPAENSASSTPIAAVSPTTGTPASAATIAVPATISSQAVPAKTEVSVPSALLLDVAFVPQAPFGNWDAIHEETCEEAAMITVDNYFKKLPVSDQLSEQKIQRILAWEQKQDLPPDLTAEQTAEILNEFYIDPTRLSTEVTVDRIKYELSQGNLIIIPAAGRLLHNPNFKGSGPIYHMVVIKGYDGSNFITNDPGTRKGFSYKYPYGTIIEAAHDWNPDLLLNGVMTDANMAKGRKVMIVVSEDKDLQK